MDPCSNLVYKRRQPENTVLYQAVEDHLDSFVLARAQEGRDLPSYVIKEFNEYKKCGRLEHGLIIVSCSDCQAHYPVALSCKRRGFCSSCCAKRMNETTLHLIDNVLPHAPYRQYVVSLPPVLRYWMGINRSLARKIHKIVVSEIDRYYRDKAKTEFGIEDGNPGGISFTQLSGSALNYNYHWHLLYLDGVYSNEASPKLRRITTLLEIDAKSILEKIVKRTIRLCKRHKLLDENAEVISSPDPDTLFKDNALLGEAMGASIRSKIAFGERAGQEVRKIGKSFGYESEVAVSKGELCYSQNGFSLHAATAIGEFNRKRLEQLIRYISRPPVASSRLKKRSDGSYSYKLKTPWDNGKTTHVQFSGEELLEKLMAIIPTPRAHLSKNMGVFSSHHRMRPLIILKPGVKKGFYQDDENEAPKRVGRSKLLMHTFKIDLSICKECGGENMHVSMAVFSPSSIARYLRDHVVGLDPPDDGVNRLKLVAADAVYEDCYD